MSDAKTDARMLVSCVIPCYKSSETIQAVLEELETTLETRPDEFDYEVICVNDGSPDGGATIAKLRELAKTDNHLVVVNLAHNFGQHSAIMAGFHQVHGDIVVCLDDDGQTPPNEVYKLIDKVVEGYDIAYASYGHAKRHAAWRNLGSRFNGMTARKYMKIPSDLEVTSYFACKRFVVDSAAAYPNPYPFVEGLLFQAVDTYCNVPVHHRARMVGESGYDLHKLVSLWSNGVTAFSVKPLRIATWAGFICALIGLIAVIVLIVQKLTTPDISEGWTSLMAVILIMSGLIMMTLGIVGEYVGRIYISLNKIPQFVVRETIDPRAAVDVSGAAAHADEGAPAQVSTDDKR